MGHTGGDEIASSVHAGLCDGVELGRCAAGQQEDQRD